MSINNPYFLRGSIEPYYEEFKISLPKGSKEKYKELFGEISYIEKYFEEREFDIVKGEFDIELLKALAAFSKEAPICSVSVSTITH